MATIIDRRAHKEPLLKSKQKYLFRSKALIHEKIEQSFKINKIKDVAKEKIIVHDKKSRLSEPTFRHSNDSRAYKIFVTGNKKYAKGDFIPIKNTDDGRGTGGIASDKGEGNDIDNFL